jgi:quinol monooxygenase YgiN
MSYVVAVTYTAKEGEAEAVLAALEKMAPLARLEPGCIAYEVHRSIEDPNVFFLYEHYVNEDGLRAHAESEHFERHIKGDAWPRLENRIVVRCEPLFQ